MFNGKAMIVILIVELDLFNYAEKANLKKCSRF